MTWGGKKMGGNDVLVDRRRNEKWVLCVSLKLRLELWLRVAWLLVEFGLIDGVSGFGSFWLPSNLYRFLCITTITLRFGGNLRKFRIRPFG